MGFHSYVMEYTPQILYMYSYPVDARELLRELQHNRYQERPTQDAIFEQMGYGDLKQTTTVTHAHIPDKTKSPTVCRRHFQTHFLEQQSTHFDSNFTEVWLHWLDVQLVITGWVMAWCLLGAMPLPEIMLSMLSEPMWRHYTAMS